MLQEFIFAAAARTAGGIFSCNGVANLEIINYLGLEIVDSSWESRPILDGDKIEFSLQFFYYWVIVSGDSWWGQVQVY